MFFMFALGFVGRRLFTTRHKGCFEKLPHVEGRTTNLAQGLHVGIWYILRAQRGSHIPTLGPKSIPYNYMDPLGREGLEPLSKQCPVLQTSWQISV